MGSVIYKSTADAPLLARLADRWAQMPDLTSRLDRLRARTLTITAALGVAFTLALAVIAYRDAVQYPIAMAVSLLGVIGVIAAPCWLRRTKRAAESGVVFCLSITVALGVWPLAMGGVASPFMPALIGLPLLFALMAGARAAAAVTLGLLIYGPLCLLVTPSDDGMPVHGVLGHNHFTLLVQMVSAVMVGTAAATSTSITARAMRMLEAESERAAALVDETELARQRFQMFADVASDWLWETDSAGRVTFMAGSVVEQLNWTEEALREQYFMKLLDLRSDDEARLRDLVARAQAYDNIPVRLADVGGEDMVFEISATPMFDEQDLFVGYMGVGRDVTARVRAENDVRFLAENDKLTGLANRHTFTERLTEQLAPDSQTGTALFAIDLDDFKAVNDTYGHHVGDALLVEVAARINSSIRKGDWAARLGGDEFIVMSVGYDPEKWDVDLVADRLMERLSAPYRIEELELYVSASIGVARYPHDADSSRNLTKYADMALYAAKEGGRNQWRSFTPAMEQTATQRKLLETGLRAAMENNELDVWYQPFVDLDSERVAGFEALARWTDEERGYIPPNLFIDVAEKCGLINDLGAYVLRRACSDAVTWTATNNAPPPRVSVNISAVQFADGGLPDTVKSVLRETGLCPSRLELEITESILMDDLDVAVKMLEALEALGVSVAIDDFGTGYSSLSYLKRFPLNRLKVDRSFIQDLESDENDRTITQTVLKLGESLGLGVIAEGVETAGQRDWLESMGCREVQGYLFAKPMPANETAAYLKDAGKVARTVASARKKRA